MKIEKPDWNKLTYLKAYPFEVLDHWFQENVEPVNSMLEGAVEVRMTSDQYWFQESIHGKALKNDPQKKALLISIEELEKKCPTCGK